MKTPSQESGAAPVQCHHPTVKRKQSFAVRNFGNRGRASDYCNRSHALRHRHRSRISVGCAARNREYSKFSEVEMLNHLFQKARPITQLAILLEAGIADARTIE